MYPIISPWLIWLISTLDALDVACKVLMFVFGFTAINMLVERDKKSNIPALVFGVLTMICIVIVVVIPSRSDMYAMLTLQYITPDNIHLVQDNVVDFVKQVVSAVREVK